MNSLRNPSDFIEDPSSLRNSSEFLLMNCSEFVDEFL